VLTDAAVNRLPQGDSYDGFPIERLVFLLLRDGIRWKAQDLRLESHEGGIAGVYTLSNGASQTSETLPARFTQPLLARLRQMLQIPSQGWPLAGSLCFNYAGREYLLEVQLGSDCEDSLLAEIAFPAS
jgi:hypothetical protein